jgi:ribosomal-protein-serine acetyltransferase
MEARHLPQEIMGERIVLRKHTQDLAQNTFDYVDKDRARLRVHLPWVDGIKSVEDEVKFISLALKSWDEQSLYGYGHFLKSDNRYMGNIGVHSIQWKNEVCELGYWILGDFEGSGYVSDAVRLIEKACFDVGFQRVEIRCSSSNFKSASVPMRTGYTMEGCLRSNRIVNGARVNTIVFSKIKGE